jgi:hypothetical protein
MKKIEILVLVILACGCAKPKNNLLDSFVESETNKTIYTKSIPKEKLEILMATNEINPSNLNVNHRYYYGFKKKLNDEHYLISYLDKYTAQYRFTNRLIGWEDKFYCIYNTERNQVISKLMVTSSDPTISFFKKQGDLYIVKSYFTKFIPKESDCNNIVIERDSSENTYQILHNKFVKVTQR